MTLPLQFLTRFAVPLIVAALTSTDNANQQAVLYDRLMRESDRVLSIANREGEGPTETYDYIIVGAGAAGAVVANRLTADLTTRVLVLDMGGDPNPISEIPALQPVLFNTTVMMSGYRSVEQRRACRASNGICLFDRGIALGGSTTVNGMFYHRGARRDYESWAEFTGDYETWNFTNVVDAFRAIETYGGVYADNPGPNHGSNGELYISAPDYNPGEELYEEALRERGLPINDMHSFENDWGFSKAEYNIRDGLRDGTYHGFITPILNRTNLRIYRYAQATRVVLDGENRAIGVIYNRHGQSRYVAASREVIVSAGIIDTPKLLMLSGIGPREHLSTVGIQTIIDLPTVGSTFQDHFGVMLPYFEINQTFSRVDLFTPETINEFVTSGTGPINRVETFPGVSAFHIFYGHFPTPTRNDSSHPDIHVYLDSALRTNPGQPPQQYLMLGAQLGLVDQLGTIRLASSNPADHPLIDPRYFEDHPEDAQRLVEGWEYLTDFMLNTTAFQRVGIRAVPNPTDPDACNEHVFLSRPYFQCLTTRAASAWHGTSSCRMSPTRDLGCVDSRLRVWGTLGLRVIDSSIMPFCPTGNPMFPSIMVGEMGARILLGTV